VLADGGRSVPPGSPSKRCRVCRKDTQLAGRASSGKESASGLSGSSVWLAGAAAFRLLGQVSERAEQGP